MERKVNKGSVNGSFEEALHGPEENLLCHKQAGSMAYVKIRPI